LDAAASAALRLPAALAASLKVVNFIVPLRTLVE
jgi:hypothetical protein